MGLGATLTSGIQDISAFLPIFGTDQCEQHIGSALEVGYLYAAATPLSLFDCLGIIKASIAILFASITYPFNGARVLHDAGFGLVGSAASMIGISANRRFEFEAASRVSECMPESQDGELVYYTHIDFTLSQWNRALGAVTLSLALPAITPYLPIIIGRHGAVISWIYPALRITGSVLCAVCAQFLLQQRIKEILINDLPEEDRSEPQFKFDWRHSALLWLLRASLMAGSGATAVGYIGCFNLVQTASSHQTFIWLGLEAALCLTRIFIWSANPRWDENIWATLTLRSPVRPKQTSTSRSYEQILSAKAKDGGGGDDHPFSVEPLEYLHPRRPMLALPDVYPWDYGSIYYALASPARGDCLYLFTVWLPWPTPSFGVVKNTAFIFVQKTGQDTAIAFYHAHLIMAGRRESKILLGSEIERSEATSRLVGMKSKGTNVDPQECLTKMLEDSREILSQFPDPTATTQEMYVSLSGNLRSFRWDE